MGPGHPYPFMGPASRSWGGHWLLFVGSCLHLWGLAIVHGWTLFVVCGWLSLIVLSLHVCAGSSLSCVSERWVGTNVGGGILSMVCKSNNNDDIGHSSSFGCHVPNCNVAPVFHLNDVSGEEG